MSAASFTMRANLSRSARGSNFEVSSLSWGVFVKSWKEPITVTPEAFAAVMVSARASKSRSSMSI